MIESVPGRVREAGRPILPSRVAPLVYAVPLLALLAASILRYLNGHATVDLAIFDQGLWSASRGHGLESSVIGESLLEDHFSPGLLLFVLPYVLKASPVWLLVAQGAAVLIAVLGLVGRLSAIGTSRAALVGASILVSPPIAYAVLFDFHSTVLAAPLALWALWVLQDDRPWLAGLLGLAAAAFRIEVGVAVLVGFLAVPGRLRPRLGPAAVLAGYLVVAVALDTRLGDVSYWAIHYSHLGTSPVDAAAHPLRIADSLISMQSLRKALPWVISSAGLALLRPRLLFPGLVAALPALLSQWPGTSSWFVHYGAVPTLLFSLAWVPVLMQRPRMAKFVIAANLGLAAVVGPFMPTAIPRAGGAQGHSDVLTSMRVTEAKCIVAEIDQSAVVSAAQKPAALLAHRRWLYLWPYPFAGMPADLPIPNRRYGNPSQASEVDYVIAERVSPFSPPRNFVLEVENRSYVRYARAPIARADRDLC